MNQLTLEEKARLLSGSGPWHTYDCNGKLPSIMMTDGPHGLRKQTSDQLGQNNTSEPATCFPTASAIACSWDRTSASLLASCIAEEALSQNVSIVLGPGINIKRSPLCGRNFEYFSEDPFLAGSLGTAYVKRMQEKGIACSLKHFAGNSQETRRQTSNSDIDERALREIYLAAFEMVVKEAHPMTIMSSYNRLNGEYACQNRTLLTDILRKEWGFQGTVLSDWGACTNLTHCINAGMDLEMPDSGGSHMQQFLEDIQNGKVDTARFQEAVTNITTLVQKQHAQFYKTTEDHAETPIQYTVDYKKHNRIAKELACNSAVLLKNEGLLPIVPGSEVLVIGALAKEMRYQGGGSSHIHAFQVVDAVTALKKAGLQVTYYQGYDSCASVPDPSLEDPALTAATAAAKNQIPILFFGGLPEKLEGEGYDRTTLSIPENQLHLLQSLYQHNDQIAFISFSGSVIDFSFENQTKAILQMYLGGQAVGEACADLITGVACPSGHLAETYPLALTDVPCLPWFGKETDDVTYRESLFVGYRYYNTYQVPVRYPFG